MTEQKPTLEEVITDILFDYFGDTVTLSLEE